MQIKSFADKIDIEKVWNFFLHDFVIFFFKIMKKKIPNFFYVEIQEKIQGYAWTSKTDIEKVWNFFLRKKKFLKFFSSKEKIPNFFYVILERKKRNYSVTSKQVNISSVTSKLWNVMSRYYMEKREYKIRDGKVSSYNGSAFPTVNILLIQDTKQSLIFAFSVSSRRWRSFLHFSQYIAICAPKDSIQ